MKKSVIAIPSSYSVVITTIVYALLAPIFFEMDNVLGTESFFIDDNVKTMIFTQQEVETECKSPCLSSAEMCIAMCA